jgi:hypothetical protein
MNESIRLLAALEDLGVWNYDRPLELETKPLPGECVCGRRISENKQLCLKCKQSNS